MKIGTEYHKTKTKYINLVECSRSFLKNLSDFEKKAFTLVAVFVASGRCYMEKQIQDATIKGRKNQSNGHM